MKFKSLILAGCLSLVSATYAAENIHTHPQANKDVAGKDIAKKGARYADSCEIEIVNRTYDDVWVYGRFNDGTPLQPFIVRSFGIPQLIDLDYYDVNYGYSFCHSGMTVTIEDYRGRILWSGYATGGTTLNVVPYLALKGQGTDDTPAKVEVKKK